MDLAYNRYHAAKGATAAFEMATCSTLRLTGPKCLGKCCCCSDIYLKLLVCTAAPAHDAAVGYSTTVLHHPRHWECHRRTGAAGLPLLHMTWLNPGHPQPSIPLQVISGRT
eukprot:GHUV01023871.1.p1 GENE.GHUV01023871.1~~GHUV01023871.1.p1  ORF type:complete len:111 (-),score=19.71 GHUV01023871.1:601-933(-)